MPPKRPFLPGRLGGLLLGLLAVPMTGPALAAGDDDPALHIGTVVVTGSLGRTDGSASARELRAADALSAGPALELVPGVVQSRVGARNEQMVQVRGFDLRQVPVFIDGVPVYVPYDGYVDLGRFNTFDLARVEVEKGYSSMLYGANTLGGAINLVGRRPSKPVEFDAGVGLSSAARLHAVDAAWGYANLGLKQARWYAQASLSHLDQSRFGLPGGFVPTRAEDGGARNNSDAFDRKLALKLGWTPDADDEYTLNLIDQHGSKGTPPYTGNLASITPRYWRWPYWDKQSLYALTRTRIGAQTLKLRLFRDTFKNSLSTYDDARYTTQARPSSFSSWYDDYTNGASAQLDLALAAGNTLGLAAHWKEDVHREHNAGEPVRRFADRTLSVAAEDSQPLGTDARLVLGVGHDSRQTLAAQDYNSTSKVVSEFDHGRASATNAQAALEFTPLAGWQGRASVARKSRFPTIKDRYSYRLGTALPNAELRAERATHVELGLQGSLGAGVRLNAALFRSEITDLIQSVTVTTRCGTAACTQMQNIGEARAQGGEIGAEARWGLWRADGHYQYLDRDNLSNPKVQLIDTPRHQLLAHLAWTALPSLTLHGHLKVASSRLSASDGSQVAGKFHVVDLKAVWQASTLLSLELGAHNLGDRSYAYAEGFPEPGREVFLQARLSWP